MTNELPTPGYRTIVLPWIRGPAERFIMPGWRAITIGPLIISWEPLGPIDLAHEIEHVRQWRRHGLSFIPKYFAASDAAVKAGGHRYHDNAFEAEARAAEEVARARLAEPI